MFTFSHVTSIGISQDEYNRRLALGEKNLVKGEAKWYREISTDLTVPEDASELSRLAVESDKSLSPMKLGEKKINVSQVVRDYIVGLKLAVNQKVQAANRDGNDGPSSRDIVAAVMMATIGKDPETFKAAGGSLASAKLTKAFAERWMADHPDFEASKL